MNLVEVKQQLTTYTYWLVRRKSKKCKSYSRRGGDDAILFSCDGCSLFFTVVIDILYRKVHNVHAVRISKVKLYENVQKALEEKMERVISKDDDWDVIIQKMAKTMKEVYPEVVVEKKCGGGMAM